ncbi:MAG: hypothetical protein ACLFQV_12085 [Vulcanimicrobiota bacterium]
MKCTKKIGILFLIFAMLASVASAQPHNGNFISSGHSHIGGAGGLNNFKTNMGAGGVGNFPASGAGGLNNFPVKHTHVNVPAYPSPYYYNYYPYYPYGYGTSIADAPVGASTSVEYDNMNKDIKDFNERFGGEDNKKSQQPLIYTNPPRPTLYDLEGGVTPGKGFFFLKVVSEGKEIKYKILTDRHTEMVPSGYELKLNDRVKVKAFRSGRDWMADSITKI